MNNMDSKVERAKALFVEFLQRIEDGESLSFETWLEQHRDLEPELRALNASHKELMTLLYESESRVEFGYEMLEEIGAGGCGKVFRAKDKTLGREVAIKVLSDTKNASAEVHSRFIQEARAMASIRHKNIIQIHAVEELEGSVQLVMELIKGRTYSDVLSQDGPLPAQEAARVGEDLCRALAELDSKQLVHMDLKPGNVMRETRGRTVLLDFGMASNPDHKNFRLGGTPPFMAPEQFGQGLPDSRTDIYGLGALLYSLTSGKRPIAGDSIEEIAEKVLGGKAEPLVNINPELPGEFVSIVEKAMSVSPEDRYPSAGHMEQALRAFLAGSDNTGQTSEPGRSSAWIPVGVLVVILTLLGVAASTLFGEDELDVQAQLFLNLDGADPLPLTEASTLSVGDKIFIKAEGAEPFYLYVFSEDDNDKCFTLYPREQELLPANTELRLPEKGSWLVTSAAGVEHLFVIASRDKDAFGEILRTKVPLASNENAGLLMASLDPKSRRKLANVSRGISVEVDSPSDPRETEESLPLVELFKINAASMSSDPNRCVQRWSIQHAQE